MSVVGKVKGWEVPSEIRARLMEGAIVVIGPDGMDTQTIKSALLDVVLGLRDEPDRPRVYLIVDESAERRLRAAETAQDAPEGAGE